jgi:pimeloyl-ACP methyl ester carboxylesterase
MSLPLPLRWIASPVVAVALVVSATAPPGAAAEPNPATHTRVSWHSCPTYSDEVLRSRGFGDEQLAEARALLDRMECGTVGVPLDYGRPGGRQITVAVTRLKAVDQAHRLGSLALNPGGPGGSGYLMALDLLQFNDANMDLNDGYDLIGLDPRGVGNSTKVTCTLSGGLELGPLTEEAARAVFERGEAENRTCAATDPAFLGQLTTANVARDLDRVRAALGERRLSFLGVSWGTWLGAVYRSMFPGHVGRMFLDSIADPTFRLDDFQAVRAAATERNFSRMAAWLAEHAETYALGDTPEQVRATVLALSSDYDTHPRQYADLPMPVDATVVAATAAQASPVWPTAAQVLVELRDSTGGGNAPPTVAQVLGGSPIPPPADAPEMHNFTAGVAIQCNEDPSRLDFTPVWTAYQRMLTRNPVTGRANPFQAGCAGWSLPVQQYQLRRAGGSLVLSGHRYEAVAPYPWTLETHALTGGRVLTVSDDIHGSALLPSDCAAMMVAYFNTGRIDAGCTGIPQPSSTNPSDATPLLETAGGWRTVRQDTRRGAT